MAETVTLVYDGSVFILDRPLDLPAGQLLWLILYQDEAGEWRGEMRLRTADESPPAP